MYTNILAVCQCILAVCHLSDTSNNNNNYYYYSTTLSTVTVNCVYIVCAYQKFNIYTFE